MNAFQTIQFLVGMPTQQSILLRAKHGVGKSSVVKLVAEQEGMGFHDVRLSQCEVGDIKGLPHLDIENNRTNFLKPYWWPRDPNSKGILFFDEMNRATKDVLQAVFEICLDRRLDGEKLPDGWRVVAAVNADDDYDVVELDPALLDRWFVIDFDPSAQEWITWARKNKVNPAIVEFIARNNNLLDPPVGNMEAGRVYPSRRSWQALSLSMDKMKIVEDTDGILTQTVKGWVGRELAVMFVKFMTNEFALLKPEDVVDRYDEMLPKIEAACSDIEVIAALANSVVDNLSKRGISKITKEQEENIKKFFQILPKDVASSFWTSMLGDSKIKKMVVKWQDDEEFCVNLRKVYGLQKKEA
jgi:hypothetical protein